jgi:glycosyltransferase involved in cell wall biosynthesis
MRIAYITPYQGSTLLQKRPIVLNRSVSNKIKIELIARLLYAAGHEVEIISHGEVMEHGLRFYRGFWETELFHPRIPVYYVSSLPIKRINGFWAGLQAVRVFKKQHREHPFDLVIIFNLKSPQISCATYASKDIGLPVILQYEDDVFVSVSGEETDGWLSRSQRSTYARMLNSVSGCMAVSTRLLSQVPPHVPKLLLRGVVGEDIVKAIDGKRTGKQNWVVFSGTHVESNGVKELINGWKMAAIPDWQLHITGFGKLTEELREIAAKDPSIMFRGMISREELVLLLCSARLCINPHAVSQTPGNVFAFKIIEYLAAGAHVVTTPMGSLEPELEAGITYMNDNSPPTIAATLQRVIDKRDYERTAAQAAAQKYGPTTVLGSLDTLIQQVLRNKDCKQRAETRRLRTDDSLGLRRACSSESSERN